MSTQESPAGQSPGSAIARVRSSTDLAELNRLDEILLSGSLGNVEVSDDPGEISRQIIAQLLAAESDEELENFGNAEGWRDYLGVPMEIHNFRWLPSTFEGDGPAVFFVVQVTDLTDGTKRVLTTGSANVLAQLSNLARRGRLPGAIRELFQASETRQGFKPLALRTPQSVKASQDAAVAGKADEPAAATAKK